MDVQVGATITNGSSCIRVTARVEKDPDWHAPGWRGVNISLEAFGGNRGMSSFVPDHMLSGWYHLPFDWRPCVGGQVEERYVWSPDWQWLQREVRKIEGVQPTVDGIRGHRVTTAAEDELRRTLALQGTISPGAVLALLTEEDCRPEHGVGHPDCPKCWRYSDRNPNRVARPS
jgi:hypothetical protein